MSTKPKRRLVLRVLAALFALSLLAGCALYASACTAMGKAAEGKRLARMEASPQYKNGQFTNRRSAYSTPFSDATTEFLFGGSEYRNPTTPIVPRTRVKSDYSTLPASGLRVTWLGHSSFLVELDGLRVLVDPVWGERASPISFIGPKRFYAPPLPMTELPDVDVVIISHDHYDHLDYPTVLQLNEKGIRFFVPLGIGAHLEFWGVPSERIVEFDWWDEQTIRGVTLVATPARHFSGRTAPGDNGGPTLWCGWAIRGPQNRAYYTGDTALFDELIEIGERLGPFDVTMIENGAYNQLWRDVHLGPEQAVRAHQLVRGRLMLPVHWGLFDLALHGWTEPVERVLVAAKKAGVSVYVPTPGEMVDVPNVAEATRWWPDLPWETAEQAPVRSTGIDGLMTMTPPPLPLAATPPTPEGTKP